MQRCGHKKIRPAKRRRADCRKPITEAGFGGAAAISFNKSLGDLLTGDQKNHDGNACAILVTACQAEPSWTSTPLVCAVITGAVRLKAGTADEDHPHNGCQPWHR